MTALSVYLAGSFADRPRLRGYRADLQSLGYSVSSSWLDTPDDLRDADLSPDELRAYAEQDTTDIDRAHSLIVVTDVPSTSGGMHWEAGYALGCGMAVYGVGPKTNIFHHLIPDDEWFGTWLDCLATIAKETR